MQSFVTVLLAGCIACLAMIMMMPEASIQDKRIALEITLEENGETFSSQQVVVEPGKSYLIDFDAGAEYDMAINIPDDRRQVKDPFAKGLERDSAFLNVNANLSVDRMDEKTTRPDYGQIIASNLILSLAEPAREIQSIIPVAGEGLLTRAGQPIESLSITIKGVPFSG